MGLELLKITHKKIASFTFVTQVLAILMLMTASTAWSATTSGTTSPCPSANNFEESFQFLNRHDTEIPLSVKIRYAEKVSQGCEGSALRFKQVFTVLKGSGVAIGKALDVAVEFSSLSNDQTKNFAETFQKVFLKKYYDFDFQTAYKISLELSRNVQQGAQVLRHDFLKLVDFCLEEKGMALPLKTCADTSLRAVKLNLNSTTSIFQDWKECYHFLREDSRLGLNQTDALQNLEEILKGGPGACRNFKKSFQFATSSEGLALDPNSSLNIAKRIALQTKQNNVP